MRINEIVNRNVKEADIPELQPPEDQQQGPSALRSKGLNFLGDVLTAKKKLSDPQAFADEEIKNYIDPKRQNQNQSLIRRIFLNKN